MVDVNGTNDFFDVSGYQTKQPAFTTFTFSRKLVTQDFYDHPFNNTVTKYAGILVFVVHSNAFIIFFYRFIWAHGDIDNADRDPNTFRFHGKKYRGAFEANVFLAPDQQSTSGSNVDISQVIIEWHGSLMVRGDLILLVVRLICCI